MTETKLMPRKRKPPKRRNPEKIARKREARRRLLAEAGLGQKAEAVAEAMGVSGDLVMDESLSCALFLDGAGIVRDVLRFEEVERKYRLLTGGVVSRYEVREEIMCLLDGEPTAKMVEILKDLWRGQSGGRSEPTVRPEKERENDEKPADDGPSGTAEVPDAGTAFENPGDVRGVDAEVRQP